MVVVSDVHVDVFCLNVALIDVELPRFGDYLPNQIVVLRGGDREIFVSGLYYEVDANAVGSDVDCRIAAYVYRAGLADGLGTTSRRQRTALACQVRRAKPQRLIRHLIRELLLAPITSL